MNTLPPDEHFMNTFKTKVFTRKHRPQLAKRHLVNT